MKKRAGKALCGAACGGSGSTATGTAGTTGAAGSAGAAGATGAAGSSTSGAAGSNGSAGTSGSAGDTGASGGAGASGGSAGDSGGAAGASGGSGAAGSAGGAGSGGDSGGSGAAGSGASGTTGSGGIGAPPIPTGGVACAAPTGGMCPDLDADATLDCNQTLVMNPGFDTAATSWITEVQNQITLSWDFLGDLDGKSASGALRIHSAITADSSSWSLLGGYQCVPVTAGSTYDFASQISVPAGQDGVGGGGLSLFFYPTTDCTGTVNGAATSSVVTTTGMCEVAKLSQAAPAGAQSVAVRLVVLKPFRQVSLDVEFDNVLFKKH